MTDRIDQLLKLHEADPNDPFGPYALAMEHAKAGRVDEAIAWLDKTLTIDEDHAYAWYHKARLLAEIGRADEAGHAAGLGLDAAQRTGDAKTIEELTELRQTLAGSG